MHNFLLCLSLALFSSSALAAIPDRPFLQDIASRIRLVPELQQAELRRLEIDRDGVVYVLTDRGVARLYDDLLSIDRSFRPLTPLRALDLAVSEAGALYYLFEDRWLSNGKSGRPLGHLPPGEFSGIAIADDGTVLVSNPKSLRLFSENNNSRTLDIPPALLPLPNRWVADHHEFFGLRVDAVLRLRTDGSLSVLHRGSNLTALAFHEGQLLLGTRDGYYGVEPSTGALRTPLQTRLPTREITSIAPASDGLWIGTTRGLYFQRTHPTSDKSPALPDGPNGIRYYAGRRWLLDDHVVDLKLEPAGHVLALTKTGLNRIELRPWTLAAKAAWFDRKIRQRHIRFGLTAERRLPVAGDIASGEIIDTDNDGGWSSYYLASQAFRFAVTGDAEARRHAWETFAALERLRELGGTNGFFARTFERKGYKYSDTNRWRDLPGNDDWEWKGHTSSDEFTSHTFAHAVLWELVARPGPERQRIASNYTAIIEHIIRHDWYLIDVDGQPTLWGRWHPDYVNHFPPSIVDRRLNSAEIIAGLQLAWHMTSRPLYRQKAEELFQRHGYLTNILSSMKRIAFTPGYIHLGNDMGDEWNHSDDELAFVNYWTLHRFAFNRNLQRQYARAIRDHWEFERPEKYPIWNFLHAASGGGADCDPDGAVWTLRGWPLDTVTWRVQNSHRHDLTPLPKNFYRREMSELIPPGERPYSRLNTQPFLLDGGDGGHIELPGDEFLFGYWLGRLQRLIE